MNLAKLRTSQPRRYFVDITPRLIYKEVKHLLQGSSTLLFPYFDRARGNIATREKKNMVE